jgi:hypothetical protein
MTVTRVAVQSRARTVVATLVRTRALLLTANRRSLSDMCHVITLRTSNTVGRLLAGQSALDENFIMSARYVFQNCLALIDSAQSYQC